MDFIEKLQNLSKKIDQVADSLTTEEATKNALIMPFLNTVLGYDVFDPNEVIPEFTADTGTKKGEKVDYALLKDGEVQILIECKKYGEKISSKHTSQLFRYFSVVDARIAILTNGSTYEFYTDLDRSNQMDDKPFLTLDLTDIDEYVVPEIKKLTKNSFDVDSIVNAAGELKYFNQIKKLIAKQFADPEEDFVKFFASQVYSKALTSKVKAQFKEITGKALKQFLKDSINERLKSALGPDASASSNSNTPDFKNTDNSVSETQGDKPKIATTAEEIEALNIVKAILRQRVEVGRIVARDTQSYFGVLLDDNNRKPICRLHFNAKQKYIGIFDQDKRETRHTIESVDDVFKFSNDLESTISYYE
jgi:hypothetical protein